MTVGASITSRGCGLFAWLAVALACCVGPHTKEAGAPVIDPPTSTRGEAVSTKGWLVVQLTRDGRILFHDTPVTLEQLDGHLDAAVLEFEKTQKATGRPAREEMLRPPRESGTVWNLPVLMRIDRNAPFLHVVWLLDALWDHDLAHVFLEVSRGSDRLALAYLSDAMFYKQEGLHRWIERMGASAQSPDITVKIEVGRQAIDNGSAGRGCVYHCLGHRTHDPQELRPWIRQEVRRFAWAIPEEVRPRGVIAADRRAPFQSIVVLLDMFAAEGVPDVRWGDESAPRSVCSELRLPHPKYGHLVFDVWSQPMKDLAPISLPVAPAAVPDKDDDSDDRLILNLDARGRILFKDVPRSLDELETILGESKRVYRLQMKAKGLSDSMKGPVPGGQATKLFVLLRADKDAPWQHVLWMLAALRNQGFVKLQFNAMRTADEDYTLEEARALGARHERRLPPPPNWLAAKLTSFTPPKGSPAIRVRVLSRKEEARNWGPDQVNVKVSTRVAYAMAGKETSSLSELGEWIQRAPAGRVGEIEAEPNIPHKFVVAVLGRFNAAGITEVGYAGVEEPPRPIQYAPYLPYPGTDPPKSEFLPPVPD